MKWLINAILQTGYRGQKTKVNGRSPLRWWRSALDCSAIEEEEEEKQEEEEEEEEENWGLLIWQIVHNNIFEYDNFTVI